MCIYICVCFLCVCASTRDVNQVRSDSLDTGKVVFYNKLRPFTDTFTVIVTVTAIAMVETPWFSASKTPVMMTVLDSDSTSNSHTHSHSDKDSNTVTVTAIPSLNCVTVAETQSCNVTPFVFRVWRSIKALHLHDQAAANVGVRMQQTWCNLTYARQPVHIF